MPKEERISIRLDANTSLEVKELSITHNVSLSTMIRALIKKSLDEVRNKTTRTSEPSKT